MKVPSLNNKYKALGNLSRYFVVTGGRGSGKSFGVCVFLVMLTMEAGHKILFCRWTMITASVFYYTRIYREDRTVRSFRPI